MMALAELPRDEHGVRLRGLEMTRIETFTDAAFAFAVTMLVISVDSIPADMDELFLALRGIPAFALSFAQVMLFWYAHHVWSRRYGLEDVGTVFLSSLLVLIVLVFIYPLKTMYSSALAWFSGGFLPSQINLQTDTDLALLFTIFALSYLAMSLAIILLYWHAWRSRVELQLDAREVLATRLMMGSWAVLASPALLSLILANTMSGIWIVSAGFVYSLLSVAMPMWESRFHKRLEEIQV
jgi:uncharacterized membrane protein